MTPESPNLIAARERLANGPDPVRIDLTEQRVNAGDEQCPSCQKAMSPHMAGCAHLDGLTRTVHVFTSTTDAYNATQTHDNMRDGDLIHVPSESVVGVVWTWPFAVTPERGELHRLSASFGSADAFERESGVTGAQTVAQRFAVAITEATALAVALGYMVTLDMDPAAFAAALPIVCGDCGTRHPRGQDCGPDPDGTYPCDEGHYGCATSLRGACRAERIAQQAQDRADAIADLEDNEPACQHGNDPDGCVACEDGEPAYAFITAAIYLGNLAYGGGEEGGWWYDEGDPSDEPRHALLTRVFLIGDEETAYAYCRDVLAPVVAAANVGRRERSSVISNGTYEARVTEGYPRPFPTRRPRYE